MKQTQLLLLLLIATLGFSCSDKDKDTPLSQTNDFLMYELRKEHNPLLEETVVADIAQYQVRLTLPEELQGELLVATFEHNGVSITLDGVPQVSGETKNDYSQELLYHIQAEATNGKAYLVEVEWIPSKVNPDPSTVIPHIYVDIDNNEPMETKDKKRELPATLRIEGFGLYDDVEGMRTVIRGRGNSTWAMPKQPYRLKLDKAASLMGLPAYKDWVLLNEYLDGSMLYNAIPYKAGQLLEIPYTNTIIPVELTINGEYRGVYAFTEHKEVGEGRIDIGDDGLLLELDSYYDEDWKFQTPNYYLPVMVQFPKSKNMTTEIMDGIITDFNQLEELVANPSFPNNNYLDYFDDQAFVDYMIVYQLTLNQEINHPKSTYINRLAGGKFRMGILWDFDWGYGYEGSGRHYELSTASKPLFWNGTHAGTRFFGRLMTDPHMQQLFKQRWEWLKAEKMDELKAYVDQYSSMVSIALMRDHSRWGQRNASSDSKENSQRLKDWLDARITYIDNYVANF